MKMFEDFTRCSCGSAHLRKEEIVVAKYGKHNNKHFFEEMRAETHYTCVGCNKLIHKK